MVDRFVSVDAIHISMATASADEPRLIVDVRRRRWAVSARMVQTQLMRAPTLEAVHATQRVEDHGDDGAEEAQLDHGAPPSSSLVHTTLFAACTSHSGRALISLEWYSARMVQNGHHQRFTQET
jgi:hypothetical protein